MRISALRYDFECGALVRLTALGVLLLMFAPIVAQAQPTSRPDRPPLSPEGTRIERQIQPPAPAAPPAPPVLTPPAAAPAQPAVSGTYILSAVVIDGATVFEPADFVPLYSDLLARPIAQNDLAKLSDAITDKYYRAGYTLTRAYIPPQNLEAGVLNVRVAEGSIERVSVTGDAADAAAIRGYTDPLTAERPLHRATLERQLLLLSDLFGLQVRDARLRPIDIDDGRYELVLDLRVKTYDVYSYLDNRGTRANGPLELWNSANVNTVGAGAWRAQAAFFTVPDSPQELLYGQMGLSHVVNDRGTVLRALASASRGIAGPPQNNDRSETNSERLVLGVTHPVLRSRQESLWASLHFDALHSAQDQFLEKVFRDELRVLRPSLYYYRTDAWGGESGINLEGGFGLMTLGASRAGGDRSRDDADASFRKVRLDAWRNQALFGSWSLYGQFAGQLSDRPLLAPEEFSLGGARFGRAYDPTTISGDRGAAGSVELRFTRPTDGLLTEYQLYGFYDVGGVSDGVVDNNGRHRLASAGLGSRFTLDRRFRLNLEAAKPLNSVEGREERAWRGFFFLSAEF